MQARGNLFAQLLRPYLVDSQWRLMTTIAAAGSPSVNFQRADTRMVSSSSNTIQGTPTRDIRTTNPVPPLPQDQHWLSAWLSRDGSKVPDSQQPDDLRVSYYLRRLLASMEASSSSASVAPGPRLLSVSNAVERLARCAVHESDGDNLADLLPGDGLPKILDALERAKASLAQGSASAASPSLLFRAILSHSADLCADTLSAGGFQWAGLVFHHVIQEDKAVEAARAGAGSAKGSLPTFRFVVSAAPVSAGAAASVEHKPALGRSPASSRDAATAPPPELKLGPHVRLDRLAIAFSNLGLDRGHRLWEALAAAACTAGVHRSALGRGLGSSWSTVAQADELIRLQAAGDTRALSQPDRALTAVSSLYGRVGKRRGQGKMPWCVVSSKGTGQGDRTVITMTLLSQPSIARVLAPAGPASDRADLPARKTVPQPQPRPDAAAGERAIPAAAAAASPAPAVALAAAGRKPTGPDASPASSRPASAPLPTAPGSALHAVSSGTSRTTSHGDPDAAGAAVQAYAARSAVAPVAVPEQPPAPPIPVLPPIDPSLPVDVLIAQASVLGAARPQLVQVALDRIRGPLEELLMGKGAVRGGAGDAVGAEPAVSVDGTGQVVAGTAAPLPSPAPPRLSQEQLYSALRLRSSRRANPALLYGLQGLAGSGSDSMGCGGNGPAALPTMPLDQVHGLLLALLQVVREEAQVRGWPRPRARRDGAVAGDAATTVSAEQLDGASPVAAPATPTGTSVDAAAAAASARHTGLQSAYWGAALACADVLSRRGFDGAMRSDPTLAATLALEWSTALAYTTHGSARGGRASSGNPSQPVLAPELELLVKRAASHKLLQAAGSVLVSAAYRPQSLVSQAHGHGLALVTRALTAVGTLELAVTRTGQAAGEATVKPMPMPAATSVQDLDRKGGLALATAALGGVRLARLGLARGPEAEDGKWDTKAEQSSLPQEEPRFFLVPGSHGCLVLGRDDTLDGQAQASVLGPTYTLLTLRDTIADCLARAVLAPASVDKGGSSSSTKQKATAQAAIPVPRGRTQAVSPSAACGLAEDLWALGLPLDHGLWARLAIVAMAPGPEAAAATKGGDGAAAPTVHASTGTARASPAAVVVPPFRVSPQDGDRDWEAIRTLRGLARRLSRLGKGVNARLTGLGAAAQAGVAVARDEDSWARAVRTELDRRHGATEKGKPKGTAIAGERQAGLDNRVTITTPGPTE